MGNADYTELRTCHKWVDCTKHSYLSWSSVNLSPGMCNCLGGSERCACSTDSANSLFSTVALVHSLVMIVLAVILLLLTRHLSTLLRLEGIGGRLPPHKGPLAGLPVVTGQVPKLRPTDTNDSS